MVEESKHNAAITFVVMGMRKKNKPSRWQKKPNSVVPTCMVMECPARIVAQEMAEETSQYIAYLCGHRNAQQGLQAQEMAKESKQCGKPRRWQKKVNTMQRLPSWSWNAHQGL